MKKIFIISLLLVGWITSQAAVNIPTSTKVHVWSGTGGVLFAQPGQYVGINLGTTYDTLKSADTLFFVIPIYYDKKVSDNIGKTNKVYPYIAQQWKKGGTRDTVNVTVTLWQSMDGVTTSSKTWVQLKSGKSLTAYSKTLSAYQLGVVQEIDCMRDTAYFNSVYLGIRYIAGTQTGFKEIPQSIIRFIVP
jgi:hypothetical protein